jgi:hypothetical protein
VLEDCDQRRLDRDPAILAALAADMDDGTVVGASKVADVGAQQFVGAQPGKEPCEDEGAVAFDPLAASPRLRRDVIQRHPRDVTGVAAGDVPRSARYAANHSGRVSSVLSACTGASGIPPVCR